jgi:hypothetical protein
LMRTGARLVALTPEEGAKTTIHLATSPAVEAVSGGYFAKCRQVEPSQRARDAAAARQLWGVSVERSGLGS